MHPFTDTTLKETTLNPDGYNLAQLNAIRYGIKSKPRQRGGSLFISEKTLRTLVAMALECLELREQNRKLLRAKLKT